MYKWNGKRERVSKWVTAEELRCHQTGQHGIVCHMQESYYTTDFRTAGRPIQPLSLNDRTREIESFNDQKSVYNRRGLWLSTNCSFSFDHKRGLGPNQPETREQMKCGQERKKRAVFWKMRGFGERTWNRKEHSSNQSLSTH